MAGIVPVRANSIAIRVAVPDNAPMPHWLIYGAAIAGRMLAGLIGCVGFYLAFFLYEDEEGRWQNRIDDLWIAVHDRARVTDTVSTAIFNRVAQALVSACNVIFGKKLVSLQMFAVSTNLSLAGAFFILPIAALITERPGPSFLEYALLSIGSSVVFLTMALAAIRFPRKWVSVVTLLPFWLTFILVVRALSRSGAWYGDGWASELILDILEPLPFVLLFSLLSDAITVVVIRRLFFSISTSLSLVRIVRMSCVLLLLLFALLPAPFILLGILGTTTAGHRYFRALADAAETARHLLLLLNATTGLYLIIPGLMLAVVLAHRLIWPVLARLIYPLSRNHILVNRKALASVGTFGFTLAFNLEYVGAKELLKLFS